MDARFYKLNPDKTVEPTGPLSWATAFEIEDRTVLKTNLKGYFVSTVFLGLNHQFYRDGPPLIFETMIFNEEGPMHELFMDRYSTYNEALLGHCLTTFRLNHDKLELNKEENEDDDTTDD